MARSTAWRRANEEVAHAVADAADVYGVPIFGMAGTFHESVYTARGHGFVAEYYCDLDYRGDGGLIITREHDAVDPVDAAERSVRAVREGKTLSVDGNDIAGPRRRDLRPLRHAQRGRDGGRRPRRGKTLPRGRLSSIREHEETGPMAIKEILSPLPGTFYRRPAPDKPTYKEPRRRGRRRATSSGWSR